MSSLHQTGWQAVQFCHRTKTTRSSHQGYAICGRYRSCHTNPGRTKFADELFLQGLQGFWVDLPSMTTSMKKRILHWLGHASSGGKENLKGYLVWRAVI
ncbi:hypothetical protein PoB_007704900 [Plakobranchus ocellatus]|uniref:Uncharacterized protein n=1 Tax=Plakobranchus ocellatus TaxID=259542 RepID=A0AAV4E250_9GAST|nr:hypothetical protein PoB_007704900 [Plakobranchus ocellatus]